MLNNFSKSKSQKILIISVSMLLIIVVAALYFYIVNSKYLGQTDSNAGATDIEAVDPSAVVNPSLNLTVNNGTGARTLNITWKDLYSAKNGFVRYYMSVRKAGSIPVLSRNMSFGTQYTWSVPSNVADGVYIVRLQARVNDTRFFTEQQINIKAGQLKEANVGVRYFGSFPSDNHMVRNAHQGVLSEAQWAARRPYFSIERSPGTIDIHEDDQRVVDQEIVLAANAGLDYWALESTVDVENMATYGYNYPLNRYMKSANKNKLMFTLLITTEGLQEADWQTRYLNKVVPYLKDPQYLRATLNRPVIYMWRFDTFVDALGKKGAQARISEFSSKVKEAIGFEPYIVMMDLGSFGVYKDALSYGVNAQTSYLGGTELCLNGEAYENLAAGNIAQWNSFTNSSLNYIPLVTIGLDVRPKKIDTQLFAFGKTAPWCQQGTPTQIAQNVGAAVKWVKTNTKVTSETRAVLIAAWSDQSESGWLTPTLGEGNARLNAISTILGGVITPTPRSPYDPTPFSELPKGVVTLNAPFTGKKVRIKAGKPIEISGRAPMAVRLTAKIQGPNGKSQLFFINGKGTLPTRMFTVTLPALKKGSGYTLTITGPDTQPLKITNITVY